jgi:hypothetical protein
MGRFNPSGVILWGHASGDLPTDMVPQVLGALRGSPGSQRLARPLLLLLLRDHAGEDPKVVGRGASMGVFAAAAS